MKYLHFEANFPSLSTLGDISLQEHPPVALPSLLPEQITEAVLPWNSQDHPGQSQDNSIGRTLLPSSEIGLLRSDHFLPQSVVLWGWRRQLHSQVDGRQHWHWPDSIGRHTELSIFQKCSSSLAPHI